MSQVLLVRHGQASWGADDYDALSPRGVEQSAVLGAALAARGVEPTLLLAGAMRRHRQTAAAAAEAAGWELDVATDEGWNEFDHLQVLSQHPTPEGVDVMSSRGAFQRWFAGATSRWTGGAHDDDYTEPFAVFTARVEAALERTVAAVAGGGTAVVFTSGGPMGWVAASALAGDATTWLRLNEVTVNTGVTKLVTGSRGTTLLTVNEHSHLPLDVVTYR
ncbi:histidine phosphatase family protein [Nocardioides sediminis]|uniref:histidine phosphatase family protein n=1 Tax=Nocardioides sediminis TaxID=433648 RepID=UPI000D31FF0C|nr:histidine phosphatase family protein [Nocardioides sediminis]